MRSLLFTLAITISGLTATFGTQQKTETPRKAILEKLAAEWVTHCIYTATELNIAQYLDNGPKSVEELAQLSGTRPDLLYRMMDTLASNGVFVELPDQVFSHNRASALLSPDHPHSLYQTTMFYKEVVSDSWHELPTTIRDGTPSFEKVYGKPVFAYFKDNPAAAERFNAAMNDKSKAVIDSVLDNYDFSNVNKLFDIGAGQGHFSYAALFQYPKMKASIFELPAVIQSAKEAMPESMKGRTAFVEGDFFEQIPSGGDIYFMKSVIHDWDDPDAKQILDNCYAAMPHSSKLLLVELVLLPPNTHDYAKSLDMLMMNITGGRERTLQELKELLDSSGFEITRVIPTDTEFSIIEARKRS